MPDALIPPTPQRRKAAGPSVPAAAASNVFIGLAIVAVLYFGHEIFVPVVLAVLLSFVLAPLVRLFRRCYAGRLGSVLAAVILAFLVIFGLSAVITGQVTQLAENLPRYQLTISDKIQSLRGVALGSGLLGRLSHMLGDISQEISRAQKEESKDGTASAPVRATPEGTQSKPILVEVQQPEPKPIEIVRSIVSPLLTPLATTGIVVVFVIFMLLFREDLRDRFIRLAGSQDLGRTSEAIDDAGRRLSRYLLTQTCINAAFGIIVGFGLWLIGIPNPVLWGIFAGLLRFVPYVGPIIAAFFPAALAIAVDPGWSMLAWTVGLFAVVEPILGQVVEPLVYGHHTGLSPVAVVVAATFWTWLWGPIGLLLSTPLTVCLVVLGRHVERLEFLDVILGDQPALTPEQSFFQRMLAGDPDEAADQAEKFLKEKSLCDYYDEIAIPALLLARADAQRGILDPERLRRIKETAEEVVDDLSDHEDVVPPAKNKPNETRATEPAPEPAPQDAADVTLPVVTAERLDRHWRDEKPVLCIAARDSLDEAAAAMLAQLLEKHGIGVRREPFAAASSSNVFRLDAAGLAMVCVSCLGSSNPVHLRYLVRRLRRRLPRVTLLVGLWGAKDDTQENLPDMLGADRRASSLRQAVELCIGAAQEPVVEPDRAPSTTGQESAVPARGA